MINSIGIVTTSFILTVGRPDISAQSSLLELRGYMASIFTLTVALYIAGKAPAWPVRIAISTLTVDCLARLECRRSHS